MPALSTELRNKLERTIVKTLDKEIKFRKTEARKILNLEDKVNAQHQIKEIEKKHPAHEPVSVS
jgi:hypothetical protein